MKKTLGATALILSTFALAGCGAAAPAPAPTVTVTVTATPKPAPTVTVTATPSPASVAPADDILASLRTVSSMVTGVEETEPGRWTIHTSIVDPRGDSGTSQEAQKAIAVCNKAVELGATYVSVMESNGSTFALYGHPSYGNVCTIP